MYRLPIFILLICFTNGLLSSNYLELNDEDLVQYVNPLIGTDSSHNLSNGNTYPAIARPWGMNFWTPQTGKMGDGWAYTYKATELVGFKQTHQPSPWINDYGAFSIMPGIGMLKVLEEKRKAKFSSLSSRELLDNNPLVENINKIKIVSLCIIFFSINN